MGGVVIVVMTADKLLEMIEDSINKNPKITYVLYSIKEKDYQKHKSLLDELVKRKEVTLTQTNDFLIKVELESKGN